ncbi:phosphodiester glycosidase family protein [Bacteroides sp.]
MKVIFVFAFLLFVWSTSWAQVGNEVAVAGQKYQKEILVHPHQVGAGVTYYAYRLPMRPLEVFFLKVDLTNPYVSMETRLANDSIGTSIAGTYRGLETVKSISVRNSYPGHQVIGAVNGDFFNGNELKNGNMQEGVYGNSPTDFGPVIGFEKNEPFIDNMTFKGSVSWNRRTYDINSTNGYRKTDRMVLYTSLNGKSTKTDDSGREVVLELLEKEQTWSANMNIKCKVIKNTIKGNNRIEPGTLVLSGQGVAANKLELMENGDLVTLKTAVCLDNASDVQPHFTSMIGSNILFLREGEPCDFTSTAGSPDGLAPRTCVGYSQDKKTFYICVVDGYPTSSGRDMPSDSKGITVADLANIMKDAGAYTAMNFDGGGSSYMYVKPKGGPGNKPSELAYSGGRSVRNALTVCSLAPEDDVEVAVKLSETPLYMNPGDKIELVASTYNRQGNVVKYQLSDEITYQVTGDIGTIENGCFIASTYPATGTIEALYHGMKTSMAVYVGIPIPSGIGAIDVLNGITVTDGTVHIPLDAGSLKSVRIYSLTGQCVCETQKSNLLNVSGLQCGIYLCEVFQKNGIRDIKKIVLTK